MKHHAIAIGSTAIILTITLHAAAPALHHAAAPVAVGAINQRQIITVDSRRDAEFVTLAGQRVNPLTARDQAGRAVSMAAATRAVADNLRVVQFTRPLDGAAVAALAQRGLTVLGAVPDNAFIIKVSEDKLAGVRALAGVRWVGNYASEYRYSDLLQEALAGRAGSLPTMRLRVFPVPGADEKALAARLAQLGELDTTEPGALLVTLPTDGIRKIAALPEVLLVDYAPLNEVNNSVAADIVDARDMWYLRNFTGSNEIVAVADTGLDIGVNTTAIHDDFEDNAGATRIVQIYDVAGDGADDNVSGHGTHVAGSALGNGKMSGSWPQTNGFPSTSYAGMAPKARLVFQAIGTDAGGLTIPSFTGLLMQAYGAGARIHQDSWGSDLYGRYDSMSKDLDLMTFFRPDLLVCFSAGNAGVDTNPANGVVDLGSMGRPGTAKNCVTVGATENLRNSTESLTWGTGFPGKYPNAPINGDQVANAPTGMAAFSSRGPCKDGRIKPDICAPGTYVASTRTHAIPLATGILWGQGSLLSGNSNYVFSGGTSMACPLVSGAAAVLREYLRINRYMTNPPAALIKAMLLNGATDNVPGQYGTGATQEMGQGPNNVEGWGRLNIERAFYGDANYRMFLATGAFTTAAQFITNITVYSTNDPLKVHLTWTDYAASTLTYGFEGGGLMNDLDLRVVDPSNRTNYPRAMNTSACIACHTSDTALIYYTGPALLWEANRFTAPQLPMTLTQLDHMVYATGAGTIGTFVWSESGGVPGTILYAITNSVTTGFWLYNFSMSVALPTTNFFVGSRLLTGTAYSARDPGGSSRTYNNTGGGWAALGAGDMWMHAYGTVSTGDHMNTVEGVIITNPPAGAYKVIVSGNNLPWPPVRFGMAISGGLVPEPALLLGLPVLLVLLRRARRLQR
jgi:hypothetical protein